MYTIVGHSWSENGENHFYHCVVEQRGNIIGNAVETIYFRREDDRLQIGTQFIPIRNQKGYLVDIYVIS